MKVAEVMTADPVTIEASASLDQALSLLDRNEIRHLPVTQDGELCGMLSDREVLERTGGHKSGAAAAPGDVRRAMRIPPEVVKPDLPVNQAAVQMLRGRLDCVAVVDRGRLVGILSEIDVLRAFVRLVKSGVFGAEHDPSVRALATHELVRAELSTTIGQAQETLVRERIRHLPLVQAGEVVAVVSDRDLRRALGNGRADTTAVGELVRGQELATVEAATRASEAALRLTALRIGALVVRDNGKTWGILTTADLLAHAEHLPWHAAAR